MIKRILALRNLQVPWPCLTRYERWMRRGYNTLVWKDFLRGYKIKYCPGCDRKVDIKGWRLRDGPCQDGQYWCLRLVGCTDAFAPCGCEPEGSTQ